MRSFPACWNNTLTKLGFKRKRRRKQKRRDVYGRRSLFEGLEQRQMLTSNTVVVDTDVNVVASDGLTSLQEAFDLVVADSQLDTITFDSSLAGKTIVYPALEGISSEVNVIGLADGSITLDAQGNQRFFYVTSTGALTLKDLTLTGGDAGASAGGAISSFGSVTLDSIVIKDSQALSHSGGAISSQGTSSLNIVDSYFHGNSAQNGGAIYFASTATEGLSITRTTFHDNSAVGSTAQGGAIQLASSSSQATITNSTFSGNTSDKWGGAIQVHGTTNTLEIVNSTITDNVSVSTVGGLRNSSSGTVTLHNTVIAGNQGSYSSTVDSSGDVSGDAANPSSHNFLGVAHSGSLLVHGNEGNQLGTAAAPLDPMLLPLAESVPGKWTHAPDELSPLINTGSSDVVEDYELSDDQRGSESQAVARVYDGLPDLGAHESGSQPIGLGESFVVNDDHVTGSQNDPWVATNRLGQTIAVWFGEGPEGTGLYTQIVNTWSADPTISNSTSVPRLVDAGDAATPIAAQVAIDDFGNYAVAWTRADDGDYQVVMRRYRADGTAVDALPVEVSGAIDYATPPTQASIVTNRAGRLLMTWREPDGDLKFRRYTTLGLSLDASPQQAASTTNGEIVLSTSRRVAAVLEDGSFFMQWGQRDTNDKLFLKLQRYSPAGTRVGEPLVYASDVEDNIPEPDFSQVFLSYDAGEARVLPFDIVTDLDSGIILAWLQEKDWDNLYDSSTADHTQTDYKLFYRRYSPTDGWGQVVEVATGKSTLSETVEGQQGGPSQNFYRFATSYDFNIDWPGLATDDASRVGIAWGRGYLNTIQEEEWIQGNQEYNYSSSSSSQR